MLRITIELLPGGNESRKKHMGTAEISLVGASEDAQEGNYKVMLSKWGQAKAGVEARKRRALPAQAARPVGLAVLGFNRSSGKAKSKVLTKRRPQ